MLELVGGPSDEPQLGQLEPRGWGQEGWGGTAPSPGQAGAGLAGAGWKRRRAPMPLLAPLRAEGLQGEGELVAQLLPAVLGLKSRFW